ncbi:MFS transporter (plasmid) [Paraburkholderia sp. PREW-6R]|uniref:MFS transporter n=1 Tax=Paraburkholderia sp. PREW-6R TaxID=3141544 RepID=UPI0031F530A5
MADVQAGIGPFVGVFLQARGWNPALIGSVMTIGGIAGMLATTPAGAIVDATRHKRAVVAIACVMTLFASGLLWMSNSWPVVALSQVATAVTGAAVGPALAGICLGLVHRAGFDRQFSRNQVANHAGNVTAAALSGWLGWRFGYGAVFLLSIAFALLSLASVVAIPAHSIDHDAARGLARDHDPHEGDMAGRWKMLLRHRPLLALAVSLALFHLGNAAMLPLYGLALVAGHRANGSVATAETIVIAQSVMVVASLAANRLFRWRGYWWVMLLSFMALPLRGFIAAHVVSLGGIWPVQILDGIGAGLQSVAVPALVVRLLQGTGRVNVGQGLVMTFQAVGAGLSPALGGWLANTFSYHVAFLTLGGISIGSIAIWLLFSSQVRRACEDKAAVDTEPSPPAAAI